MPKSAQVKNTLPGIKPVLDLLADAPDLILKVYCRKNPPVHVESQLAALCQRSRIPFEMVDASYLNNLASTHSGKQGVHQGVAASLREKKFMDIAELLRKAPESPLPMILALDQGRDPGNLGTLCRTAYALGCAGLILPRHNSAGIGPGAFKASGGTIARLDCALVSNLARTLDMAEESGFHILAASRDGGGSVENAFFHTWRFPSILVLGSEQDGIRPGVMKRCAASVEIPMARNFESLNVAQAGAILMGLCAAQVAAIKKNA